MDTLYIFILSLYLYCTHTKCSKVASVRVALKLSKRRGTKIVGVKIDIS